MNLQEAKLLAELWLEHHDLKDWKIAFDKAKLRFGKCVYREKIIYLSQYLVLLNAEKDVEETILHEIAHALVGQGQGHNYIWRAKANAIGCSSNRCFSAEIVQPQGKYKAVCNTCGAVSHKHRMPRKKIACIKCCKQYNYGRFSDKYLFLYR